MKRQTQWLVLASSLIGAFAIIGCSVHTSRSADNKKQDVDIRSPFGSISVHEGGVEAKDTGLPVYPGAKPRQGDDEDGDNANVNVSIPFVGVKVVVQKFESDDSPDKVLAFYQKPMGKYGNVIQCSGTGHHTFHHHGKDAPVSCDGDGGSGQELKAGTEDNQHVVAVTPRGSGSEFTLIYVRAREGDDDKDTI